MQNIRRSPSVTLSLTPAPWALSQRAVYLFYLFASWQQAKRLRPLTADIQACGNYYLDVTRVKTSDVVYSCGVGDDVAFDEGIHQRFGCTVDLFDPTPLALDQASEFSKRSYFRFHPWGVWVRDEPLRFYVKNEKMDLRQCLSATNLFATERYFEANGFSLETIMRQLGHDRIDILKLDIEGAALPVLKHLVKSTVRPRQIVFEIEKGIMSLLRFHSQLRDLQVKLVGAGYELHFLPKSGGRGRPYNFHFLALRSRHSAQPRLNGPPVRRRA